MAISRAKLLNLRIFTPDNANNNAQHMDWNLGNGSDGTSGGDGSKWTIDTGNGGDSTVLNGGDGGGIYVNLGDGGDASNASYVGGTGGGFFGYCGAGGAGSAEGVDGGDGGRIQLWSGAGGAAVIGTGGTGGDGGEVHIRASTGGNGDVANGAGGTLWLQGIGEVNINTSSGDGDVISGNTALTVDWHHRGYMSIGDSAASPSAVDTSVSLDFRGTVAVPRLPRLTTTQRNALTALDGMIIYNTTDGTAQVRNNGSWVDFPYTP